MPYTPNNHPYIPGDPYSYDLKWMVKSVKDTIAMYETTDAKAEQALTNAAAADAKAQTGINNAATADAKAVAAAAAAAAAETKHIRITVEDDNSITLIVPEEYTNDPGSLMDDCAAGKVMFIMDDHKLGLVTGNRGTLCVYSYFRDRDTLPVQYYIFVTGYTSGYGTDIDKTTVSLQSYSEQDANNNWHFVEWRGSLSSRRSIETIPYSHP